MVHPLMSYYLNGYQFNTSKYLIIQMVQKNCCIVFDYFHVKLQNPAIPEFLRITFQYFLEKHPHSSM